MTVVEPVKVGEPRVTRTVQCTTNQCSTGEVVIDSTLISIEIESTPIKAQNRGECGSCSTTSGLYSDIRTSSDGINTSEVNLRSVGICSTQINTSTSIVGHWKHGYCHRWFLATQKIDTVVRENLSINFGLDISVALASQRKILQHVATKGHRILPLDVISSK